MGEVIAVQGKEFVEVMAVVLMSMGMVLFLLTLSPALAWLLGCWLKPSIPLSQ